jgi:hypothetical protein
VRAGLVSDDLPKAREFVRWFPALVSNHVVDLLKKYPKEELPPELVAYVDDRPEYNYLHHAQVGSDNGRFVPDEIVDRYCVVGGVAEQVRRMQELRDLGVHQFNIYLMCGDEEKQVKTYADKVIPALKGRKRSAAKAKPARSTAAKSKSKAVSKSKSRARR